MVEKFNDQWRQKLSERVIMECEENLKRESLAFEQRHNLRYRYTKLNAKTPMEALAATNKPPQFLRKERPPKLPLPKPETGCYHVIRIIRSDAVFNLFGEQFSMPSEAIYEYVWATVDVSTAAAVAVSRRRIDRRTSIPAALTGRASSEACEVYHPMFRKGMGNLYVPHPTHRLRSLTGLCLGGVLASKNRLRFTRRWQLIMQILNDVVGLGWHLRDRR